MIFIKNIKQIANFSVFKSKPRKIAHKRRIFAYKSSLLPPPPVNKSLSNETKPRSSCGRTYLDVWKRI